MIIKIPDYVNNIILQLTRSGYSAYAVGGAIRDSIMGREVNDWDITTDAETDEIKQSLYNFKIIETGIKHGTLTVLSQNHPVEITTFRIDGQYIDNRHPESVVFTKSLREDLKRRDFTVNAIAYNETDGLVDYFGGSEDINSGVIRCVRNPDIRFNEDALRILRALRFSSILDFRIEKDTSKSILKNRHLLKNISSERITKEFSKLICGKNAADILNNYYMVFQEILPEIKYNNGFDYIDLIKPDFEQRLSALVLNSKADAFSVCKKLKLSNKSTEKICFFSAFDYDIINTLSIFEMKKLAGSKQKDIIMELAEFNGALFLNNKTSEVLEEIFRNNSCLNISQLAVDGNDLKSIGINGKKIKYVLEHLLDLVIENKTENNYQALINKAGESDI